MAGTIPPEFIDQLLSRIDVVEIIDARVPLKKAGKNFQACCPFHSEKSPSFTVSPDKQFYHCFGCGAHGTAIGFLMEYDQLSFPEVIQELATHAGLAIPQQVTDSSRSNYQNLYDVLEKVAQFYRHQLHNHPQSAEYRQYLEQRGLHASTIEQFEIGLAPDGWDHLQKTLGHPASQLEQLKTTGMLTQSDKGRWYDRFRARIMFPIRDRRGRVVGFGGRVIDPQGTPKYLNSPETPIFHKGHELFGFYQARKAHRQLAQLLIVEGYMDVVALANHGIHHAVATLGTATTPDHLKQLVRAAPEVVFCFDGDRAGREAAWRALENALPLLGGNFALKFMFLPEGEDPDSMVNQEGASGFLARVAAAQSLSSFFLESLQAQVDLRSLDGRARLLQLAQPYLKRIPSGFYRDLLEQQLAELTQTSAQTLGKHLQAPKPTAENQRRKALQKTSAQGQSPIRKAVTILVQHPRLAEGLRLHPLCAALELPGLTLLMRLIADLQSQPARHTAALLERWREDADAPHLERLAVVSLGLEEAALRPELEGILAGLSRQAVHQRLQALTQKGMAALTPEEREEVRSYQQR